MNREELITRLKEEYAGIATDQSQQHFHETTTGITPGAYYKNLLELAISEVNKGTFDNCRSATEVINKIAADKTILSEWGN